MAGLMERMIGAAKLDAATYNEVEADTSATTQALLVVVVSAVAAGIGALNGGVIAVLGGVVVALIAWAVWAFVTYFVGTKFLAEPQTEADWGQLLRTLGFASTPGILRVLGIVPSVGGILALVASVWMLVASVIAVREALDYTSTGRAIAVCVIGAVFYFVVAMVLGLMLSMAVVGASALSGGV